MALEEGGCSHQFVDCRDSAFLRKHERAYSLCLRRTLRGITTSDQPLWNPSKAEMNRTNRGIYTIFEKFRLAYPRELRFSFMRSARALPMYIYIPDVTRRTSRALYANDRPSGADRFSLSYSRDYNRKRATFRIV